MTIRVLLADDQALLRATFRLLLDSAADIEVVGEADNGALAVEMVRATAVDLVLMDIRMPEMDGVEATRRITADQDLGHVRVLILTTFEEDDLVLAALRAGASGFLGKGVSPQGLLDAIRTVVAGDQLLSPIATRTLVQRVVQQPDERQKIDLAPLRDLTEREVEMVRWVATGMTNDQIAERLVISSATVKTHVNRAMVKTGSHDRAQLVVLAFETGLVRPGAEPGSA